MKNKNIKDCLSIKKYQDNIKHSDDILDRFNKRYSNFQGYSQCSYQETGSSCKICKGYSNFDNNIICIGAIIENMQTLVYRIIKNNRLEDDLFEI